MSFKTAIVLFSLEIIFMLTGCYSIILRMRELIGAP